MITRRQINDVLKDNYCFAYFDYHGTYHPIPFAYDFTMVDYRKCHKVSIILSEGVCPYFMVIFNMSYKYRTHRLESVCYYGHGSFGDFPCLPDELIYDRLYDYDICFKELVSNR